MGWLFNKNNSKKDSNQPSEMSPIEAVTYICTAIQLSDGEIDFSEKNIWEEMISELFPDFSDQRALKFFTDAQLILNKKSSDEKNIYSSKRINKRFVNTYSFVCSLHVVSFSEFSLWFTKF